MSKRTGGVDLIQHKSVDWERGIGAAESHAASPVRVIPVTAAVLAFEERRNIPKSTTATEWRKSLGLRAAAAPRVSSVDTVHLVNAGRRSLQ